MIDSGARAKAYFVYTLRSAWPIRFIGFLISISPSLGVGGLTYCGKF
jgi:hypothetical protein